MTKPLDAPPSSDAPNPGIIFETLNLHQRSAALHAAIELDLFSAIAREYRTVEALTGHLGTDRRATRILCDFLVIAGFLTKEQETYGLPPVSAEFLDRASPKYVGSIAKFMNSPDLLDAFKDIAQVVRTGTTTLSRDGTTATEYAGWIEFARSMAPIMMPAAMFMADMAARERPGAIRVLDIAAGHGMFGVALARKNPQAAIVALDWAPVLEVARENAAAAGVQDRYTLLPGDAFEVDYGGPYDVVLVTNFLHHFDPATCEKAMRKVAGALAPGGLVLTLEFVPDENRIEPPIGASFAFTMLGTTPKGDAYTFAEYDAMWRRAGLAKSRMVDVPNSGQRLIFTER